MKMTSIKTALAVATAGAVAMTAAACGSSSQPNTSPTGPGGTFTTVLAADAGNLDPHLTVLGGTNYLLTWSYDMLITTGDDGRFIPWLAKSWEVTPTSVTFHLRDDVTCADGSKVTASTVAQNFAFITDPKNKSPLVGVMVPPEVTAKADDATGTVTITSPKPDGFLIYVGVNTFIVCGEGLKDRSLLAKRTSGSGLYQLTESISNDHYTFDLRKDYAWGPGGMKASEPGVPSKVVLKVITSQSTAVNLLASGQLNTAQAYGPDRKRLESMTGVEAKPIPESPGMYFFNQAAGRPGKDLALRKALASAVNIDELITIAGGGSGAALTGLISLDPKPCGGDTVAGHRPAYDVQAAKAALDAAGWIAGADGVRAKDGKKLHLRVIYSTDDTGGKAAVEFMTGEWQKIGVTTEIKGLPPTQLPTTLFETGDWEVGWIQIGASLPSQLVGFLSGPTPPNGTNFAHLSNAEYTKLITEATGLPGEPGCQLWNQAEVALFDNFDVVPVVANMGVIGVRGASADTSGGQLVPHSVRMRG